MKQRRIKRSNKPTQKKTNTKSSFSRRMYNKSLAHSGEISVKCEADVAVQTGSGLAGYYLAGTSLRYINLATLFTNSLTWTTMSPLYAKFKVNSITIQYINCNLNGPVYNTTNPCPFMYVNFVPDKVGTDLSTQCASSDSSLLVQASSLDSNANSRTFYFPNNYFPGPGVGLGVWNNPANVGNILGEICVYTPTSSTAGQAGVVGYLSVRINVVFDQLNK